ncbi:unnamed protein product [Diatraea saccharalis]|uniref:Uncharacterized protein n=1 Tax=Diatraea saccharalis TaxID=40085 RepID=A0A9N9WGJ8_9NEOP|nr:unnamed protein product [Diatraea saccharalis]
MLQRFRVVAHDARARSRTSRRLPNDTTSAKDEETTDADAAYDVTHYFVDDVTDPWREGDALERERLSQHAALRELVSRGDVAQLKAKLASLGNNAGLIVNLTPGGANTLFACEAGLTSVVAALLEAGADGRCHPITRYGPLYVACYQGHLEIAKLLLAHFPTAVQSENSSVTPEVDSRSSEAAKALSPQRGGISLGIHAIVSKLTGGGSKQLLRGTAVWAWPFAPIMHVCYVLYYAPAQRLMLPLH